MRFSFRGLMAPVFTPFTEDQSVDYNVIPNYAKYLHDNQVRGILVNGTTGEGVSLTVEERKKILKGWVNSSRPYDQTIMVQIGGTNMSDMQSLAMDAESNQVSAILCLPDLFFKPSKVDDLIHYLKIVSQWAPNTPLLYYHIPSFTGVKIDMKELLRRSKEIPTFSGIKFTDNDLDMGTYCVNVNSCDLSVFLGCDSLLLPALVQGFDSAIGTTINMFPNLNNNILTTFRSGDIDTAQTLQKLLNRNIDIITKYGSWVSSMKAAMNSITPIKVGTVRDPLIEVKLDGLETRLYGN